MKLQRWDWGEDSMHELSYGDWCASDDVRKLEESHAEMVELLKESRDLIEGVCEEYRSYRGLLDKIDKVLNNIEGTK